MASPAQQPLAVFTTLPANQKIGVMIVAAAFIALMVGAWMWSQTPDYRVLYSNVSDRDGGAIIASLQQMNVPYKFADGGGAVMVPANRVHEARLRLAAQGLPKGGQVGFELMENQKFGTSQFVEQINYQRGLEGELARSIQSLSAVAAARVHLALTQPSPFLREQQKPGASVLVNLQAGRSLDAGQVAAIVTLVATSVPNLEPKSVTVVDQNGNLLSQNGAAPTPTLDPNQLKYVQEIEASLARRIETIITPIAGPGNVKATVTANVDFSEMEQAEETFKPNQTPAASAVRSQQSSESLSGAQQNASGIPGALSNQPPGQATAPINAPAGAANAAGASANAQPVTSHKDSTVNYEVDKSIRHMRGQVGTVKRLSVAVVVNHVKQTDAEGKVTTQPLPKEEMDKINDLVKEAIGFNKERGDSLNVVNSPFNAGEKEVLPETPLWKSPTLWNTVMEIGKNLLIAGLIGFLVLGVLRPFLRSLMTPPSPEGELVGPEGAPEAAGGTPALPGAQSAVAMYEHRLEAAKQLAKDDPKLVANVVRGWVSGGNE